MSNEAKSNEPIGAQAAAAWNGAAEAKGRGDGLGLLALISADWGSKLDAVAIDGKLLGRFTIDQMRHPPMKEDGKRNGVLARAMRFAIFESVFAVPNGAATDAVEQGFRRVFPAAAFIKKAEGHGCSVSDDGIVSIPAALAFDLGTEEKPSKLAEKGMKALDAALRLTGEVPTRQQLWEKLQKLPIACNGEEHPFFDKAPGQTRAISTLADKAREAGFVPAPKRQAQAPDGEGDGPTPEQAFMAACRYIAECIDTEGDEAPCALNNERRRALFRLQTAIASYFALDPIEEERKEQATA